MILIIRAPFLLAQHVPKKRSSTAKTGDPSAGRQDTTMTKFNRDAIALIIAFVLAIVFGVAIGYVGVCAEPWQAPLIEQLTRIADALEKMPR